MYLVRYPEGTKTKTADLSMTEQCRLRRIGKGFSQALLGLCTESAPFLMTFLMTFNEWLDSLNHMIYLIFSHFLEILFPFCYAISTFKAAPYMLSSTMMSRKVMSSEMTDFDRPCIH